MDNSLAILAGKQRDGTTMVFMSETKNHPDHTDVHKIRDRILDWYAANGRDLPWRHPDTTAWGVLVSEVMLQQTQVSRVWDTWLTWMQRWPGPQQLAQAETSEVLIMWGRLGYPRRALRLHETAKAVVTKHDGKLPADPELLIQLPGIGEYTAAAVASFAFQIPEVVIDTNIRRVHARIFSGQGAAAPSLTSAERQLAARLMPDTTTPEGKTQANTGMLRPWNLVRCYVQLEHQNATSVRYSNNALGSPPANLSQLPKPNPNPGTAPTAKSVVQLWVCYVPRAPLTSPHYKPLLKPPAGWANTFPNSLNGIGP